MPQTPIPFLIDKQDSFEIVRDQIAQILANEVANQVAIATSTPGADPADYDLEVYPERAKAWEKFLSDNPDQTPVVNVWYDTSTFLPGSSSVMERQQTDGVFNIDCYGSASNTADGAGFLSADEQAAKAAQRAMRLVRNILMAASYTYLDLQGLVGQRWPQSVVSFQPAQGQVPVDRVQALRMAFMVKFVEFSPQAQAEVLESLAITLNRASDGRVLAQLEYDYTT